MKKPNLCLIWFWPYHVLEVSLYGEVVFTEVDQQAQAHLGTVLGWVGSGRKIKTRWDHSYLWGSCYGGGIWDPQKHKVKLTCVEWWTPTSRVHRSPGEPVCDRRLFVVTNGGTATIFHHIMNHKSFNSTIWSLNGEHNNSNTPRLI